MDKQIEIKRPFGCLTQSSAKWVDMLECLLQCQHFLRSGDKCHMMPHGSGQLGPLSIYCLDKDIRLENPEKYLEEANRWVDMALPRAHLINMVNLEVYMVTCAAKGRELCCALTELRKNNRSLEDCYEELLGQAKAALDARFRVLAECCRLATVECICALTDLALMMDNQSRLYAPSREMSRALVCLTTINTLTMSHVEMQMYTGSNEALMKRNIERYENDLSVNLLTVIGLPMPANDLTYLCLKLMSMLQASLLHLDVVLMHDMMSGKPVEWLPNLAAYLMGVARNEFEQASVEDVLPRIKTLLKSDSSQGIVADSAVSKAA